MLGEETQSSDLDIKLCEANEHRRFELFLLVIKYKGTTLENNDYKGALDALIFSKDFKNLGDVTSSVV